MNNWINSYAKLAILMHIWNDRDNRACVSAIKGIGIDPWDRSLGDVLTHYFNVCQIVDDQIREDIRGQK